MLRNGKEGRRIFARGEKWVRKFSNLRNMARSSAQAVTAKGIFKLQNGSVAQNAEALGSLKRKRKKAQVLPPIVINRRGYLSDSFLVYSQSSVFYP